MDVDPGAVPVGQPEHRVQVPDRVPVGSGRVDAADDLDAVPEGLLEQVRRAGAGQDAVLRERNLLDGDPPGSAVLEITSPAEASAASSRLPCPNCCA